MMENTRNAPVRSSYKFSANPVFIVTAIGILAIVCGSIAASLSTEEQMYIIWPAIVSIGIFLVFCYVLWFRIRTNIIGELGVIYLAFALAYTVIPAVSFLKSDFGFPPGFSGLLPQPIELGAHFWRHVLFIAGVALGYFVVRGRISPTKSLVEEHAPGASFIIGVLSVMLLCSVFAVTFLSSPVTTYYEHYTRYDHLSWFALRFVYACLIFKSGSYFVILALMFRQYRRYWKYIIFLVPIICAYELAYSFGSRIETLTILLAIIGFYHFSVNSINIKKGVIYLASLALLFSLIETVRTATMNDESVQSVVATEGISSASEFGAVYNTGFHLYSERAQGHLPSRDWEMFFSEFVELIPFIDHTIYNPQYWYARNYFPDAVVPPQTMGVIADSAIWGGEFDLLARSLINGALFALIMRWFYRRQEKWWALTIYTYCYATCILTLKYSVFHQLVPLIRILLPVLLITGILSRIYEASRPITSFSTGGDSFVSPPQKS